MQNQIITNKQDSIVELSPLHDAHGVTLVLRPKGKKGDEREITAETAAHEIIERVVKAGWVYLRPVSATDAQDHHLNGPSIEEWVEHGYLPENYEQAHIDGFLKDYVVKESPGLVAFRAGKAGPWDEAKVEERRKAHAAATAQHAPEPVPVVTIPPVPETVATPPASVTTPEPVTTPAPTPEPTPTATPAPEPASAPLPEPAKAKRQK